MDAKVRQGKAKINARVITQRDWEMVGHGFEQRRVKASLVKLMSSPQETSPARCLMVQRALA